MKTTYIVKYVLAVILLLNVSILYGQNFPNETDEDIDASEITDLKQRKFYVGFMLGLNTMNLGINTVNDIGSYGFDNISSQRGYGFSFGLVSNLRLSNSFDLRLIPTISFSDRGIKYSLIGEQSGYLSQDLEVTFVEFPLLLKYTFDSGNIRKPYLLAGINYAHDLASIELGVGDEILVRTKRNDVFGELGIGLERPLTYFVFGLELKASMGLINLKVPGELDPDYYTAIDHLRSRNVSLSITIE